MLDDGDLAIYLASQEEELFSELLLRQGVGNGNKWIYLPSPLPSPLRFLSFCGFSDFQLGLLCHRDRPLPLRMRRV
jgi:hypothetical protein